MNNQQFADIINRSTEIQGSFTIESFVAWFQPDQQFLGVDENLANEFGNRLADVIMTYCQGYVREAYIDLKDLCDMYSVAFPANELSIIKLIMGVVYRTHSNSAQVNYSPNYAYGYTGNCEDMNDLVFGFVPTNYGAVQIIFVVTSLDNFCWFKTIRENK